MKVPSKLFASLAATLAAAAAALFALPSGASGRPECNRPRCALTPHIVECNESGGFPSVERDPCRVVCSGKWVRRISEEVCADLP